MDKTVEINICCLRMTALYFLKIEYFSSDGSRSHFASHGGSIVHGLHYRPFTLIREPLLPTPSSDNMRCVLSSIAASLR